MIGPGLSLWQRSPLEGGSPAPTALPQSASRVAHWSAEDLIGTYTDGQGVLNWVEPINGASADQPTFANQPIFKTNQLGGKPCVRYDGVNDSSAIGFPPELVAAIDSRNYTVFLVIRPVSAKSNGAVFAASIGGNSAFWSADGNRVGRFNGNTNSMAPTTTRGFITFGTTSQIPYTIGSGTGLERSYCNGGCYIATTSPATTSGGNTFWIGTLSSGSFPANVDVFDIIVWSVPLTPAEMVQAHKWACDKYSQTYPWASAGYFLHLDGDSLIAGVGATSYTNGLSAKVVATLGLTYGQWTNTAVGGITMANLRSKISEWSGIRALVNKPVRLVAEEYYNQRGTTPPGAANQTVSYAANVRAISGVKLCLVTSTSHSGDPDANRVSYNNFFDTNFASHCDAYLPIHTNSDIGLTTSYATNGAGAGLNLWSDGVHFNNAGYTVKAGLVSTAVAAMP